MVEVADRRDASSVVIDEPLEEPDRVDPRAGRD
jgi:hypothetical protein